MSPTPTEAQRRYLEVAAEIEARNQFFWLREPGTARIGGDCERAGWIADHPVARGFFRLTPAGREALEQAHTQA